MSSSAPTLTATTAGRSFTAPAAVPQDRNFEWKSVFEAYRRSGTDADKCPGTGCVPVPKFSLGTHHQPVVIRPDEAVSVSPGRFFCGGLFRPARGQHFPAGVPSNRSARNFPNLCPTLRIARLGQDGFREKTHASHSPYLTYIHGTNFKVNLLHNPSVQNARKEIQRRGRSMTLQAASDLQLSPSGQSRSWSFFVCLNRPLLESEVVGTSELYSTPYERQSLV